MFILIFCAGIFVGALLVWLWSLSWIEPDPVDRREGKCVLYAVGRTYQDLREQLVHRN